MNVRIYFAGCGENCGGHGENNCKATADPYGMTTKGQATAAASATTTATTTATASATTTATTTATASATASATTTAAVAALLAGGGVPRES
jgi:hypothetical protein